MAEDTNFEFGMWIADEEAYPKIAKLGHLGQDLGHLTYFYILGPPLYLWDPLYIASAVMTLTSPSLWRIYPKL